MDVTAVFNYLFGKEVFLLFVVNVCMCVCFFPFWVKGWDMEFGCISS